MNKINTDKKIILGIDPGIERLGIAVLEFNPMNKNKETVLYSECFITKNKDTTQERLALIYNQIENIIKKYSPDIVAIEKIFFTNNQKTAVNVAQARGVVLSCVGQKKLQVFEISPTEMKLAITGYGRATKSDIIKMIPKIVNLPKETMQDDEIDAIAIALSCTSQIRYSQI